MPARASTDPRPPTGTVTFLFTDIEGSTRLWETQRAAMQQALAHHDAIIREAIAANAGYLVKTTGDGAHAAFPIAADAMAACLAAQRALQAHDWGDLSIKSRMALHSGAAEERDGDYYGPALNRAARLMAAGHGGQILLSLATGELVRDQLPADISLRDMGVRRLKDLIRPERVYQVIAPGLSADFPPLRTLDVRPNNLPQQLTSFIGREKETAEIAALLARFRVLTLTGSGGCGKTRLSLQVAAESLEQYPDGTWFVELASLSDPDLVPHTVATALGAKEDPGEPITRTLAAHLENKQLLLLLDNCEHLLDPCAKVADALVRRCPGVRILATSREALGIAGEQAYRVPSLSLPDRQQAQTPQALSQYEAVRLFIDRALLVRADFQVTNQNAPALASLCHRLDGIPLAIELAAARVRSLSVEEIDGKLDQRFRLLTGGSRMALPRHQTLRSLIDWSYDLLHDAEQLLLQRLSVFAGGWTLAAAEQVCASEDCDEAAVLDLLSSLLDKSLVVGEQNDGHSRYRLLETVRQYARERLREAGEEARWQKRHLAHFVEFAETLEPPSADQLVWLDQLEMEHDNLRAALTWSSAANGDAAGGLRLAGALWRFWSIRGYLVEGRGWLSALLTSASPGPRDTSRGNALHGAGELARTLGDYPAARALHQQSLAIWRELGDRRGVAASLNGLGLVDSDEGDYPAARARFTQSLAIIQDLGELWGTAMTMSFLGTVTFTEGDCPAAQALHEESLTIFRKLGDRVGAASALGSLARAARAEGDYVGARERYRESLAIRGEVGDRRGAAASLTGLAYVALALGHPGPAARILGGVERLREEMQMPRLPKEWPEYERSVAAARVALGGDAAFDRAWQEGRAMTLEQAIALALEDTGERG